MRRIAVAFFACLLVSALLLPPWRIAWTADPGQSAEGGIPPSWAGFHPWSYAQKHPTKVEAWDGPRVGGHIAYTGRPRPALAPWAVAIVSVAFALYLAVRATNVSQGSKPPAP
jgi:hypothetical protein